MPWGSAAATSSGAYSNGQPALEVGGFYSHQPAAGALGGAAARRGTTPYTPVYAGGAYYTAAVGLPKESCLRCPCCCRLQLFGLQFVLTFCRWVRLSFQLSGLHIPGASPMALYSSAGLLNLSLHCSGGGW